MQFVRFGSTGLKVSRLCLGCMSYGAKTWRQWVLEEEESRPLIRRALERGINFFDTADMYSLGAGEEVLGRALKDFGPARDRLVIATKVFFPMSDDPNDQGLSRKHIFDSIDKSLRRLGTDYVDLYQIHRFDRETPIEETLQALDDLIRAGKVRYIGASAMWAWQFMKMQMTADKLGLTRFASMQCYYNILYREQEREMLPLCQEEGVAVIPYSPLARGFVAGKYKRGGGGATLRSNVDTYTDRDYYTGQDFAIVDRITEVAARRGIKNTQVALAWMLQKPAITAPIFSATKTEHIDDAVAALDMKLEPEDMQYLEELYKPRPILGHA
jgi:aryl-alcohol dehydrogenase-like predicted oxidoreductase